MATTKKKTEEVKAPKTTKTASAKKETKTAEKKPEAKKTTTTKASATKVFVEYQGNQVSLEDILTAVQAAAGKAKSLEIYVKPEDGAAYYVAGNVEGKVEF